MKSNIRALLNSPVHLFSITFIMLLNSLTLGIGQMFFMQGVKYPFVWVTKFPNSFFLTVIILTNITLTLTLIFRKLLFALLIQSTFFLSLSLIGFEKKSHLGMYLFPWDLKLGNEALSLIPVLFNQGFLKFSTLLLAALGLIFFVLKYKTVIIEKTSHYSLTRPLYDVIVWNPNKWVSLLSIVSLCIFFLANNPAHDYLFKKYFFISQGNAELTFLRNGPLIGFILYEEQGEYFPPANYSVKVAQDLIEKYQNNQNRYIAGATQESIKPDIIILMSESLFDPLKLKNIKWKQDPLKYTRTLVKNRDLNAAVVSTFGFRTANTEFEFLTGNSLSFFSKGVIPYINLFHEHHANLTDNFKKEGYALNAIHPGARSFYNRNEVYQKMGFDHFSAADEFVGAPLFGQQISDNAILEKISEQVAITDKKMDKPFFDFIVTIQNHYPYDVNPFDLKDTLFEIEGLTPSDAIVLNHYSKLIANSDEFHKNLIALLGRRNRPTLLVIFGDHLPPLQKDYGLYDGNLIRTKNPSNWNQKEWLDMYTTPLVIWSNFGFRDETGPISLSLLGPRILKQLNLRMTPFQEFEFEFSQKIKNLHPEYLKKMKKEEMAEVSKFRVLQYANFQNEFNTIDTEDKKIQ